MSQIKRILKWDDYLKIKFRDTHLVREPAISFEEKGRYCPYDKQDPLYKKYWQVQEYRSLFGDWFPIGPAGELIFIPGYHYWYLNFCPIMKIRESLLTPTGEPTEEYLENIDIDPHGLTTYLEYDLIRSDRIDGFPDFYDGDVWHYKYIDEAERLGIFGVELKVRGVGASFKAGGMATRNFYLIPNSRSFLIAENEGFLLGDGCLQKAWDMMAFIDKETAFAKLRQSVNTISRKRASYEKHIGEGIVVESGYKSEIMGITTKNDPNKVRGIRGKLIYLEEAGKDPYLLEKWMILMESVKRGKATFGFMMAAGTGGIEGADYKGLNELFWKPKAYNLHHVYNYWNPGMEHKETGFFWPVYINAEDFMDKDGNSDIEAAKAYELKKREEKLEAGIDREAMARYKAERPFDPIEATLNIKRSVLPVDMFLEQLNEVDTNPLKRHYGRHGYLYRNSDGKVSFRESDKHTPLDKFPYTGTDKTGCITIYDSPYTVNGLVPKGLYLLNNDPYYQDKSTGPSLGATYVYKKVNNFNRFRQNTIVASYVGRPATLEQYLNNLFMLAEYYNCKICFENDKGRSIPEYAKRHNLLGMLQSEFEFNWSGNIKRPGIRRGWGYKMSSGKDDVVRNTSEQYLADWCVEEIFIDEEGKSYLNLHTLYDRALLEEGIAYGDGGNYDRIDALLGLMLYIRETIKIVPQQDQRPSEENFFSSERTSKFYQHEKWY